MGLTKTALIRPIFIFMLMLAAVVMGLLSYNGMRVEQNPDVQFGVVTISTIYPGAGPDEINTLISRKIEESVSGVNGLREVTSTSQEGISVVVANFEIGTDMNEALNDIRAKVDLVVGELPTGVEKPTIAKIDSSASPVLTLAVNSKKLGKRELRDLLENQIKDRFAQINGVASVDVAGGEVRELQVRLRADRLLAYKIGIAQVQRAVQLATLNVPSGRIQSSQRDTTLRVLGEFKSVEDLANTNITVSDPSNPMGASQILRLRDIATVTDGSQERLRYTRLNGVDAVTVDIQKVKEGNAVDISKAARALFAPLKEKYGVEFVVTQDSATYIQESISDLTFALVFGIVLVAAIVYLFLHNFRGMAIVAVAIPICIMSAIIAMRAMGFTINNLSMLGLSLAVGVLVDDAIVVLENIFRHLQMGEDPREAAINGRGEIGVAAIAITLADIVVFVPIGTMGGIVGQFYRPLALSFVACVAVSLVVSFTVTPLLAARWYRKGENVEHFETGFAGWFERSFARFTAWYRRALTWALDHRWFVFILGNLALVAAFMVIGGSNVKTPGQAISMGMPLLYVCLAVGLIVMAVNQAKGQFRPQLIVYGFLFGLMFPTACLVGWKWADWKQAAVFQFQFLPNTDAGLIGVSIELPPGSSLRATGAVVEEVENRIKNHPDIESVVSKVGSAAAGFASSSSSSNLANIVVKLNEKKAIMDSLTFWVKHEHMRTASSSDVAAELTKLALTNPIPGAKVTVSAASGFGFGAPIQLSFTGDDRAQILQTVDTIRRRLAGGAVPGVINPDITSKPGKPELLLKPDRARLADVGLSVSDLAGSMRILYEGNKDAKFRIAGREYDIRVQMEPEDRDDPTVLDRLPISFYRGNPVFLREVSKLEPGIGVDKIERRDRVEEIRLTTELLPGFAAGNVQDQVKKFITDNGLLPTGVAMKDLGQSQASAREGVFLMTAMLVGLMLVYMVLASLYNNVLYPFIIQLSQPQALVGAFLALMIADKAANIIGVLGFIALIGLVGKNAILVVDYTNTLRARGKDRREALLEACPLRMRPITMTTLALVLGTLPVALAIGRGSEFRETIGISIIGGISLSTLLTLFVIPCSYTIFDDLSRLLMGKRYQEPELIE